MYILYRNQNIYKFKCFTNLYIFKHKCYYRIWIIITLLHIYISNFLVLENKNFKIFIHVYVMHYILVIIFKSTKKIEKLIIYK